MTTSNTIELTMDDAVRSSAQHIFANMGMTESEAIQNFYEQIVYEGTMPAVYRVPNAETLEAMREAEAGHMQKATSVAEFMRMLDEDD